VSSLDSSERASKWIEDTLAPYLDNPKSWIVDHQSQLQFFLKRYGKEAVVTALASCLEEGKLTYFFKDFGRFKPASSQARQDPIYTDCTKCGNVYQKDRPGGCHFCGIHQAPSTISPREGVPSDAEYLTMLKNTTERLEEESRKKGFDVSVSGIRTRKQGVM